MDYYIESGYEKRFMEERLEVGMDLRYGMRDYENAGDRELYKVGVSVKYKV